MLPYISNQIEFAMRKIFIILLMVPLTLFAQSNEVEDVLEDTIQNAEVKISISKLTNLENAKLDFEKRLKEANKRILELELKIRNDSTSLKKAATYISKLRADSLASYNEKKNLKEQLLKSDKCLISVASNFLYIPYEAYSIDSIAIRSYETVSDKELKQKYYIRYSLLKSYRDDISNLVKFLTKQQNELNNNPFNKDAKEAINALHGQSFYVTYLRYDDWASTFLGSKIVDVEKQLKSFNGKTKIDFSEIINRLQSCLKNE